MDRRTGYRRGRSGRLVRVASRRPTVAESEQIDLNGDGLITPKEATTYFARTDLSRQVGGSGWRRSDGDGFHGA